MRADELAKRLKDATDRAAHGEKVVSIYLFGIEHARELKGHNLQDIAEASGNSRTYGTELAKAVKLAPYVTIRGRG